MNVRQVLIGAAKRLEEKGWCQGCYGRTAEDVASYDGWPVVPAGAPCGAGGNLLQTPVRETDVIGAMRQTGKASPAVDEAKERLRTYLRVDNLADWNDDDHRTREDVVAALRAAAKLA